jgi:hypothetical protein
MHPDWALALLRQCKRARVPFHFKQWGHWAPLDCTVISNRKNLLTLEVEPPVQMIAVGKKLAGRTLKGTTWDEMPRMHDVTDKPQPYKLAGKASYRLGKTKNVQRQRQRTL